MAAPRSKPERARARVHRNRNIANERTVECRPVPEDEFRGQVALVTGSAGQGIGRATAARLCAGGAHTVVTDVHAGRVERVTEEIAAAAPAGVRVIGKVLDVSDFASIHTVVDAVAAELGPIQILVHNAAYNVMGPIFTYRPED